MSNDVIASYDHFTSHTGEYRHKCGKCNFKTYSLERLQIHHKDDHRRAKKEFIMDTPVMVNDWPYIYICKLCLHTQINRSNLEKHNNCKHHGRAEIIQANMFRSINSPNKFKATSR